MLKQFPRDSRSSYVTQLLVNFSDFSFKLTPLLSHLAISTFARPLSLVRIEFDRTSSIIPKHRLVGLFTVNRAVEIRIPATTATMSAGVFALLIAIANTRRRLFSELTPARDHRTIAGKLVARKGLNS
ncbi:unnamed protein product [Heligmosomoides polygyrus]|uniref:Uncharacterized protein n=1 Tax=Heligmosomoides polygyrus TaxID=6339 RepID=A0A183GTZ7_HELPZ|nr:unnamed protein product [Heligmosomoides polygyrus]